jgi:cyclopropane-fatty-acyl-phospholipid synthase
MPTLAHPRNFFLRNRPNRPEPPAVLRELAASAGLRFNGDAPWDIQVHDAEVYRRILSHGSLGFGEAYMDGLWDAERLDELFRRLLGGDVDARLVGPARLRLVLASLRQRLFNLQSVPRAFHVGERHYDIGNDVFAAMLDSSMSYSCAWWAHTDNLEQAQQDKLDLICRKLELRPGEHLLEIGCGWGGLAHYAASHYGVTVSGITVSREQREFALERCRGLPVNIALMDYRDIDGHYDKAVSVGMFEHVGPKNYAVYFDTVKRVLKDEGLFLLHSIGSHVTAAHVDPWIDRYIFPNGYIPSARQVADALEGCFLIEDWHNFGQDYDRTLMAWWDNFERAWPRLAEKYDERFRRMWKYYLHSCAGYFRAGQGQLWQLVLSRRGRAGVYRSVR